ncbi:MAG: flippase-like domain-containing protein [Bacteroidales bacterium]|nr:flippase-like domain-containing protein [Bacteroidales bacterium]
MSNLRHAQKPTHKDGFRRWFGYLRLFGIGLFVVLLFRIDFSELGRQLALTRKELLLMGLFFQFIVLVAKGVRWHLMNEKGNSLSLWRRSLGRFYESYAIGVVTPGRMGELLKAGHERNRGNIMAAIVRVVAERGLDIGVFVILAGLSVVAGTYLNWPLFYGGLVIFFGVAAIFISMLLLASKKFNLMLNQLLRRLPGKFKNVEVSLQGYSHRRSTAIILLSLASNLSYFVSCYFLALSVGLDVGFVWTSGAVAVSGLLNMLPVTIMGVGTRELTFLFVFKAFPQALVLSFSFLVMLVAQIGGGLMALVAGQLLLLHDQTKQMNHE